MTFTYGMKPLMDHGAKAAAYVGAFMATINWPNVRRLDDGERK